LRDDLDATNELLAVFVKQKSYEPHTL